MSRVVRVWMRHTPDLSIQWLGTDEKQDDEDVPYAILPISANGRNVGGFEEWMVYFLTMVVPDFREVPQHVIDKYGYSRANVRVGIAQAISEIFKEGGSDEKAIREADFPAS